MTKSDRPLIRATGIFHKAEEIIVELQPTAVVVRLKGLPSSRHEISYAELYKTLEARAEFKGWKCRLSLSLSRFPF